MKSNRKFKRYTKVLHLTLLIITVFVGFYSAYRYFLFQQHVYKQELKTLNDQLSELSNDNVRLNQEIQKLLSDQGSQKENLKSGAVTYETKNPDYSELINELEKRIKCWEDNPPKSGIHKDCSSGEDRCIETIVYGSYHEEEVRDAIDQIIKSIDKLRAGIFVDIYSENAGPLCPTR